MWLKPSDKVLIDSREYADLKIATFKPAQKTEAPMSRQQLTMLQLGSYLPNFEMLASKPQDFKNSVGVMCDNLIRTAEWQYLVEHLKQDQVNKSLFTEGISYTDDFIRGSINGIYVVDEQIRLLGMSHQENVRKGIAPSAK